MRENSDLAQAKAALGQFQVGRLKRISRRGVLKVEVAAQEEVSVGVMWGSGGKSAQGGSAVIRGCVKGTHRKTQRVGFGTLRHINLQVSSR